MMPMDEFNQPLNSKEIKRLERFFEDGHGLLNPMANLSEIDGYTAALCCLPDALSYSQWVKWVWDTKRGRAKPKLNPNKDIQAIDSLLNRHKNSVLQAMIAKTYLPITYEADDLDSDWSNGVEDWCRGFVRGMSLNKPVWRSAGHFTPENLAPIFENDEEHTDEAEFYLGDFELFGEQHDFVDLTAEFFADKVFHLYSVIQGDPNQLRLPGFNVKLATKEMPSVELRT
jgi:yecA family protein